MQNKYVAGESYKNMNHSTGSKNNPSQSEVQMHQKGFRHKTHFYPSCEKEIIMIKTQHFIYCHPAKP